MRAVDLWRRRTQFAALVMIGLLVLAGLSPPVMAWMLLVVAVAFAGVGVYAWLRWRRALIDAVAPVEP